MNSRARKLLAAGVLFGLAAVAVACGSNDTPAAPPAASGQVTSPTTRSPGTTARPRATDPPSTESADTSSIPGSSPTSSSASASTSTTARGSGAASTTSLLPGGIPLPAGTYIPPGTSAEDKAWCAQAKPITQSLSNLFQLTPAQFEALVNQSNALVPSAPAAVKPPLTFMSDVGTRFLAAVKAGQATISFQGIATWASTNLTQQQQTDYLNDVGTVIGYINRTC